MRAFEIFLQNNILSAPDIQRLIKEIAKYENDFTIEAEFNNNQIGFYLFAKNDISHLATEMEGFILKPTDRIPEIIGNIPKYQKIRYSLPTTKNILEIIEMEKIKNQRIVQNITVTCKRILTAKLFFVTVFMVDQAGKNLYSSYYSLSNPLLNFEFDFTDSLKIKKKSVPLYLQIDDVSKLFTENEHEAFLEVFGFPHFSNAVYFPLNKFEFGKHSLIVGQTGVGKSKFIELFIKNMAKHSLSDEYTVVIIDPHASLYPQFLTMKDAKMNFDFIRTSCNLFPSFSEPKIATELTILLFKTLLKDQFNAKMERVLKYSIYMLFLTNRMSLESLKKFLVELEFRKEVLSAVSSEYDHMVHFFETEFVEMQTKFYEISIMPVLVLVDELNFIPAFSNNSSTNNLEETLKSNFLTAFSLNRIFLGDKATRLIAGLIIQQLFLIAQKGSIKKKIILIIDEVSLIENESMISILSEARKFNLSLFLSQQYLTQIMPELLKGILSNVYNYFVFKMSDEDAKILAKNLDISFPDEILIKQKEKGLSDEDLKRNLLVTLNPRECLVRVFARGKFFQCFKAKTLDI